MLNHNLSDYTAAPKAHEFLYHIDSNPQNPMESAKYYVVQGVHDNPPKY